MSKRNVNIKHSKIFNYWKDKAITPNGDIVIYDDMTQRGIPVVFDWGEPCCWACGRQIKEVFEYETYEDLLKSDVLKIWDYAKVKEKLNKCHIIPYAEGGSDSPENMFLLCETCHIESPDTINPKNFLKWVYKRRMKEKSVNGFIISEFMKEFLEDCKEKGKDPRTMKPSQAKAFKHGSGYAQSSLVMALADTCDDL